MHINHLVERRFLDKFNRFKSGNFVQKKSRRLVQRRHQQPISEIVNNSLHVLCSIILHYLNIKVNGKPVEGELILSQWYGTLVLEDTETTLKTLNFTQNW